MEICCFFLQKTIFLPQIGPCLTWAICEVHMIQYFIDKIHNLSFPMVYPCPLNSFNKIYMHMCSMDIAPNFNAFREIMFYLFISSLTYKALILDLCNGQNIVNKHIVFGIYRFFIDIGTFWDVKNCRDIYGGAEKAIATCCHGRNHILVLTSYAYFVTFNVSIGNVV